MKQVVKRLELISAAISLGENEIIISQTKKLRDFPLDLEAEDITSLLEKRSYEEVITKINHYLKKFSDISAYEDPRVEGIRVQIKTFEHDLITLSNKKYETIKNIFSFNTRYHTSLGEIVENILKLEVEMATMALEQNKIDNKAFKEIERRYTHFLEQNTNLANSKQHALTQYEQNELQRIYKKIASIINPSLVVEEFKDEATELFAKLNNAYVNQELSTLKEVQSSLRDDVFFVYSFESIEDRKSLKQQSKILRKKIELLENELHELNNQKISKLSSTAQSLEAFFSKTKKELIKKQATLRQNRQ